MPSRLAASEQGCNRYISFSFDLAASAAWDVTQIDGIAGFISLGRHPDRWNRRLHQPGTSPRSTESPASSAWDVTQIDGIAGFISLPMGWAYSSRATTQDEVYASGRIADGFAICAKRPKTSSGSGRRAGPMQGGVVGFRLRKGSPCRTTP
ncbi:MAG: hypothetical protein JRH01_11215 [Deltaproteobacteria bacterium]|nr:hypothetical protein [Deltaproteobacteria bacterium]